MITNWCKGSDIVINTTVSLRKGRFQLFLVQ